MSAPPRTESPSRRGCSTPEGMPSCANAASSGARQRSTESQTTATFSGGVPPRSSATTSLATSSTVPRVPAPSRNRSEPSSAGPVAGSSAKSSRSRCVSAAGTVEPGARGSSSMLAPASAARSSTVPVSAANATRPGSYGMESVTSVRAASVSTSAHSAPVRSSKP